MPKPGPRTTCKYSEEFKATAVRLSELPGVAAQDVAESLYIHPFMLSRWRKQAREGLIMVKGVPVDKDAAGELKELRRMWCGFPAHLGYARFAASMTRRFQETGLSTDRRG
jgi:transposase